MNTNITESTILTFGQFQVRTPAHPESCSYIRIVEVKNERERERVYWDEDEFGEDPADTLGALMGLLSLLARGGSLPRSLGDDNEWEPLRT